MRVLVLGADGYLGWPTCMDLASAGHTTLGVDNYLRRSIAEQTQSEALISTPLLSERAAIFTKLTGHELQTAVLDCTDFDALATTVRDFAPEVIIHYAEQPSAPYSMKGFKEAQLTLRNNLDVTFNVIWAIMQEAPECHLVKLGTMGEYGTPNIDIEEGWLDVEHNGRTQKFLYPRQAGSLYHTTKVLDTDLLWFYVRTHNLRVTDLMQGPVYGISTPEADLDPALTPNFHYDDIFGTVLNRFLVQAVADVPLTVYGKGGQTRGYLDLRDTLQCVRLATEQPADPGQLRIFNQFTETFSVNELADRVAAAAKSIGIDPKINHMENPRKELEDHYYNPAHSGLTELGLQPHLLTEDGLVTMLQRVIDNADRIDKTKILPRVSWSEKKESE